MARKRSVIHEDQCPQCEVDRTNADEARGLGEGLLVAKWHHKAAKHQRGMNEFLRSQESLGENEFVGFTRGPGWHSDSEILMVSFRS
jgi:hypothetical protein